MLEWCQSVQQHCYSGVSAAILLELLQKAQKRKKNLRDVGKYRGVKDACKYSGVRDVRKCGSERDVR